MILRRFAVGLSLIALTFMGGLQNPPQARPQRLSIRTDEPGSVFYADQPVVARIASPAGNQSIRTQLVDFGGRVYKTPAVPSDGRLDLGRLPRGYYTLTATDGDREVMTHLTVIPKPRPRRVVRTAVDAAHAWLIPPERFDDGAELLRRAGINFVRERFSWPEVERERGKFAWGRYDAVTEAENKRGIQVYQVFHQSPGWSRADHAVNRYPDDLRDVYNFCRTAAEHYRFKVQAWEVWNEADISVFSMDPASDYAAFLKAAYLGFKAGDPKVNVTQVSLALASPRFHESLYKNGSYAYFDIFNYHIYDKPAAYQARAHGHFEILDRAGVPQAPVWLTEAGIPLKADNETLTDSQKREQAEFIGKSFAMSLAAGTDRHFFFVFPHYLENGVEFGLTDANLRPYPGYAALATAVDALGEAKYLGRLQTSPDVDGRVFENGNGDTLVLWSDQPPARVTLSTGGRRPEVFDCVGTPIRVPQGDPSQLTLELGSAPIYVRAPRGTFTNYTDDRVKRQPGPAAPRFAAKDLVLRLRLPDETADKKSEAYSLVPGQPVKLRIEVYNFGATTRKGSVKLTAPAGWSLSAGQFNGEFAPGCRMTYEATLTPGPSSASGRGEIGGVIVPAARERWTGGRAQSAPVVLEVVTKGG